MACVLVVDDDPQMLEFLCTALLGAGHSVERAVSGTGALHILDDLEKPVDLLLADIVMPGLNGFHLALMGRLRRPQLRVLYITGHADLDIVAKYTGPNLGNLVEKPVTPEQLRSEVERAMAHPPRGV